MKVALCVSGHFRTFVKCKDGWFRYLIDLHNPDVFIHTWTDLGFSRNIAKVQEYDDEARDLIRNNKRYGRAEGEFYRNTPLIGNIYECLNPKKIVIEDYRDVEDSIYMLAETLTKRHDYDYPPSLVSQLRKTMLANCLKKDYERDNNFIYDVVIRIRPDVLIRSDIVIEDIDIIHTPAEYSYQIISDIFAYSTSANMDKYCSLYDKLEEYRDGEEVYFNPHELLKYHLQKEQLKYIIDDKLRIDLERDKSGIT